MKKYKEYIETRYKFLPLLPKNWELNSGLSCFEENKKKNTDLLETLLLQFNYGTIIRKVNQEIKKDDEPIFKKYTVVEPNDIILNGLNLNYDFVSQRVGIVEEKGIITSAYLALRCRKVYNPFYANYMLKALDSQKIFNGMGSGVRLTLGYPEFSRIQFPVPPREEQDQIVRYLDWQVSKINKLIHGYQKQIKLLEEYKKSQIVYFVTHGIKQHQMVESEIYWLDNIPKDWRVTRLKHILKKQQRPIPENAELLICSNSGEVKKRGDSKMGLVADSDDIYQGVKTGDLLIHGMDTWHGAIAVSDYDGMCTPVVHVCTSNESVRFISYYLKMMAYTKVFKAISNGVRQNTSDFRSWDKTGALYIALPTLDEQEQIANRIDETNRKINSSISAINREIEALKEYRTRLISDVVTGQIDVRDIVIPDYIPEEDTNIETDAETDIEEVAEDGN